MLALLASGAAGAQVLPLDQFVAESDQVTALQASAGTAIQATCTQLVNAGGLDIPDDRELDLFLRCQEVVRTAAEVNSGTPAPRSLGYSDEKLAQTLQQYAGEELTSLQDLSTRAPSGQFANISGRLNALRLGTATPGGRARTASLLEDRAATRGSYAFAPDGSQGGGFRPYDSLLAPAETASTASPEPASPRDTSPWGWFLDANYNFGDRDATVNEDGFDFDAYSATLGVDYLFGAGVWGVSFGYDDYGADFDVLGSAVRGGGASVRGLSTSAFFAIFGERLSFNAIASYGEPESNVTRKVEYEPESGCTDCGTTQTLTGTPGTDYFSFGATLAYEARAGGWDVTPSVSLSVRNADVDGYTERNSADGGGLALAFEDQSIDSTRAIIGLDLARPISRNFGVLTPNFRAEWHHEFEDEARTLQARFAFAPDGGIDDNGNCFACFSFVTDTPDTDFGVVGAGLSFLYPNRLQAYLYAETLVGAQDFSSTSIAVGIRGQF
jgi:uncharacterized protein with beta-barrel porin domain